MRSRPTAPVPKEETGIINEAFPGTILYHVLVYSTCEINFITMLTAPANIFFPSKES